MNFHECEAAVSIELCYILSVELRLKYEHNNNNSWLIIATVNATLAFNASFFGINTSMTNVYFKTKHYTVRSRNAGPYVADDCWGG